MNIIECIDNVSTFVDLKRIAIPYVVDYRRLNFEELKDAIKTAAKQYYDKENVINALEKVKINTDIKVKNIAPIFIKDILMNKDDFMENNKVIEDEIIKYESSIIDKCNEEKPSSLSAYQELFTDVLSAAWEKDGGISEDEQNLLNKIQRKLNISYNEAIYLEAKIGKYPTVGNVLNTKEEIGYVRRYLQSAGLLFTVRDSFGVDFDILPEELVGTLREIFSIDIKRYSFSILINYKYVRNKAYLLDLLKRFGIEMTSTCVLQEIQNKCLEKLTAQQVLGGFSALDGLDKTILSKWCVEIGEKPRGTKQELIKTIIDYYDKIRQVSIVSVDDREILYNYYVELASRELKVLRMQGIIDKDLETEKKFESATNYLFETKLLNKPLIMTGNEHPDGMLSLADKLILWDNKSKETPVNLLDHIKQFDRYIRMSAKHVAVFLVIAPSFTEESMQEALKYGFQSDTMICLITAEELKDVAESWALKHPNEVFPLAYFKQSGRFNKNMLSI